MDFNPTPEELNRAQRYHQASPPNLDDPLLLCSGSKWGEDHLRALKVVAVDEVSLIRIIPEEYLTKSQRLSRQGSEFQKASSVTNEIFRTAYRAFRKHFVLIRDDHLREWTVRKKQYPNNLFRTCFARLAEAMTTRPAHVVGTTGYDRNPSPDSDLSSLSQEDKPEQASREALHLLVEQVLDREDVNLLPCQGVQYFLEV